MTSWYRTAIGLLSSGRWWPAVQVRYPDSPWYGWLLAWRDVSRLRQELAPGESDHSAGGDCPDEDGDRCDRGDGICGCTRRVCPGDPLQRARDADRVSEREEPEPGREPQFQVDGHEAHLDQGHQHQVPADGSCDEVDAAALQCEPGNPRHGRRG